MRYQQNMASDKVLHWISNQWNSYGDSYMTAFPILNSPLIFVTGIIVSLGTIFVAQFFRSLSPDQQSQQKPAKGSQSNDEGGDKQDDIRPLLLIHDGFCFGVYGVATLIFLIVGNLGQPLYACNASKDANIDDLLSAAIKHLTYVYLLISFVCFGHPLIQVLGGHSVDVLVDIFHHSIWSCLSAAYLTFNPVGLSLVLPILDCLGKVAHYGSSVLAVTNRDASIAVKWSDFFRCIVFSLLSFHSFYFLSVSRTCFPPQAGHLYQPAILLVTALYAGFVCLASGTRFLLTNHPINTSSFEKQMLSTSRTLRKNVRLTKIPVVHMMK